MLSPSSPGMRIAVLLFAAVVLGTIVWGGLSRFTRKKEGTKAEPLVHSPQVPIPVVDRTLLARVKDETKIQRFTNEPEAYEHLLVTATRIVPGTLRAMGLPEEPIPPDTIRRSPDLWRGKPLFYEGEVVFLKPPEPIPGMRDFQRTEGRLRTDDGETILFAVIEPIPEGITLGSFARIEGLFFKLRDENFPEKVEKAPFLVGPVLRRAFRKFPPVKELDPDLLATIRDGTDREAEIIEDLPFYHLCSWVANRPDKSKWRRSLPEIEREDAVHMVHADGTIPRGASFKIVAELLWVQIEAAEANPLRVDFWTKAWLYHPTIGTIYVKIPGRVSKTDWKTGDDVVVFGAFMKRYRYETGATNSLRPGDRYKDVPFFVSDDLLPLVILENEANVIFRAAVTGAIALLIIILGILVIKDHRADQELRRHILERRRKRRRASIRKPH